MAQKNFLDVEHIREVFQTQNSSEWSSRHNIDMRGFQGIEDLKKVFELRRAQRDLRDIE